MAEIDLKFMKGNKATVKAMRTDYGKKPATGGKKTVKKAKKK